MKEGELDDQLLPLLNKYVMVNNEFRAGTDVTHTTLVEQLELMQGADANTEALNTRVDKWL